MGFNSYDTDDEVLKKYKVSGVWRTGIPQRMRRQPLHECLRFHADRVEECGHLNAARYMREAADALSDMTKARKSK